MKSQERRLERLEASDPAKIKQWVIVESWKGETVPDPPDPGKSYIVYSVVRQDGTTINLGDPDCDWTEDGYDFTNNVET